MTPTPYNAKRKNSNRPAGYASGRELMSIPNARALGETGETAKALRCDFGDDGEHWVPKSQIATQSEVKRHGDRGRLDVTKWWAESAGVMKFALRPSLWTRLSSTRRRLQELDRTLAKNDPARGIIKTICDALREDLAQTTNPEATPAATADEADTRGGGDGSGIYRQQ